MPTGYTAKLMDKGQTFPEFIMGCARAFGACVTLRDDDPNTPIPERFEPSDYDAKRLAEAQAEISKLLAMGDDEKLAFGENEKTADIARMEKYLAQQAEENKRLQDMEAEVNKWTPPSPEHAGLKKFMLEQLEVSKGGSDYWRNLLTQTKAEDPIDFYIKALAKAEHDLAYHIKSHDEEVERTNRRNEWLKQLRESI